MEDKGTPRAEGRPNHPPRPPDIHRPNPEGPQKKYDHLEPWQSVDQLEERVRKAGKELPALPPAKGKTEEEAKRAQQNEYRKRLVKTLAAAGLWAKPRPDHHGQKKRHLDESPQKPPTKYAKSGSSQQRSENRPTTSTSGTRGGQWGDPKRTLQRSYAAATAKAPPKEFFIGAADGTTPMTFADRTRVEEAILQAICDGVENLRADKIGLRKEGDLVVRCDGGDCRIALKAIIAAIKEEGVFKYKTIDAEAVPKGRWFVARTRIAEPAKLIKTLARQNEGVKEEDLRSINRSEKFGRFFHVLAIQNRTLEAIEKAGFTLWGLFEKTALKEIEGRAEPATAVLARTISTREIEELAEEMQAASTEEVETEMD